MKKILGITEEEDIKNTKTFLEEIKKYKSENGGKISIEMLKKVGEMKCC